MLLSQNNNAQNEILLTNESGLCLSIVPHYVLTSTFKGEIDKQLGKGRSWLSFSVLYADRGDDSFWNFSFNKMLTRGGSLSYRYYVFSKNEPRWLYVQSGLVFNYTEVLYDDGLRWVTYDYDGLEAIRPVVKTGTDKIHQYGADFKIGCVIKLNRFLFFDFYAGVGLRRAEVEDKLNSVNYGQGILGPGFEGILPVMGVRFGVNL